MPTRGKKTVADGRPSRAKPGAKNPALPFVPTVEQRSLVTMATAIGMTHRQVAARIINPHTGKTISTATLHEHFRMELENGAETVELALAGNLYTKAMGNGPGAITAGIFMLKCRFGWKDRDWGEAEPLPAGSDATEIEAANDTGAAKPVTVAMVTA